MNRRACRPIGPQGSRIDLRALPLFPALCCLFLAFSAPSSAGEILHWNATALNAIKAERTTPPEASRALAMLHLSLFDALNAISPVYEPYRYMGIPEDTKANPQAALAVAGHRMLSRLFPGQQAILDQKLAQALAPIPEGESKTQAIRLGEAAALTIWNLRKNDNGTAPVPAPQRLDLWEPTPPEFKAFLLPSWGKLTPFSMSRPDQFRKGGPPALTSAQYASGFNEVKTLGSKFLTTRTPEQTQIALFWADGAGTVTPPGHWNVIAQTLARQHNLPLMEQARLFAMLNVAMADAAIAAWDMKAHFYNWRPQTAIRKADLDNNPDTSPDPSWESFILNPPFPDYVSGHSTFSGAASRLLSLYLQTDNIAFSDQSEGTPGIIRSFTSLSQAAQEAGKSRVYGGIHFEFANQDGLSTGQEIAQQAFNSLFLPVGTVRLSGDADNDGRVSMDDADLIAKFLVGLVPGIPNPKAADAKPDGLINIADALVIAQFVNGLRAFVPGASPRVIGVIPLPGALEVSLTAPIHLFMSNPIDPQSVNQQSVILREVVSQNPVPLVLRTSQQDTIITALPLTPLLIGVSYEILVSTAIKDKSGNFLQAPFASNLTAASAPVLAIASGNNQQAPIKTVLPKPVVIRAATASGASLANVPLTFQVNMGDGSLYPSALRNQVVFTDSKGEVSIEWRMGGQAVTQDIIVTGPGFSEPLIIQAIATFAAAKNLRIFAGNNQNCPVGITAPFPLEVKATDEGGNIPKDPVQVTFKVIKGDGFFAGQSQFTASTNHEGIASAMFTHGSTPGVAQVEARFNGMIGQAPIFTLVGLTPDPAKPTAIVGTIINTSNEPLPGLKVFLRSNPNINTVSDDSGFFRLEPVPPGPQSFIINALESPPVKGIHYADLGFELNAVEGQDNTIQMPAIVPPLDIESAIDVSEVQGGTLTLRADPKWKLIVNPNQASFFLGPSPKQGKILVTLVPTDKIPMPPPEGKYSRFFVAIEPYYVEFDPPAQVTFPNADNLPPGTITEIFSFDHNIGRFTPVGRAKVAEDGETVTSLPGSGIVHGGWHQITPPEPAATTCLEGPLGDPPPGFTIKNLTITGFGISGTVDSAQKNYRLCNIPSNLGTISPFITITLSPDSDRDGIPNELELDDDDDGIPDHLDRDRNGDGRVDGFIKTVETTNDEAPRVDDGDDFGPRKVRDPETGEIVDDFHHGLDIQTNAGDPAFAPADSGIEFAGFSKSAGNMIIFRDKQGNKITYMHLESFSVTSEQKNIKAGTPVGITGQTGKASGPHLHIAVQDRFRKYLDPVKYFQGLDPL